MRHYVWGRGRDSNGNEGKGGEGRGGVEKEIERGKGERGGERKMTGGKEEGKGDRRRREGVFPQLQLVGPTTSRRYCGTKSLSCCHGRPSDTDAA